jgi:hypothetical protein
MSIKKQTYFKDTDIISASEIGQYHYCSVAWYLQKCGYEPKSPMLDIGIKKHLELGKVIDYTQANIRKTRAISIIGYLLLIIGVLIFLLEVIL